MSKGPNPRRGARGAAAISKPILSRGTESHTKLRFCYLLRRTLAKTVTHRIVTAQAINLARKGQSGLSASDGRVNRSQALFPVIPTSPLRVSGGPVFAGGERCLFSSPLLIAAQS
jgi:hypothetical protein